MFYRLVFHYYVFLHSKIIFCSLYLVDVNSKFTRSSFLKKNKIINNYIVYGLDLKKI